MWHRCYTAISISRHLTQRELRNQSGEIMRALDRGEQFILTRNGVAVAELRPLRRRRFVALDTALAAFSGALPIDSERFREDLDLALDQDSAPRA